MVSKQSKEEAQNTIVETKIQLMLPPSGNDIPTFQNAHFLKPLFSFENQTIPKPPSLLYSSNPNILERPNKVLFKGMGTPHETWKIWVDNLQKTHQNVWKKVGIFDAIRGSTYIIKRHNELIVELAKKWCPKTNTFIFSWGESTVTLEDVMILGGLSIFGVSVSSSQKCREFEEIEYLANVRLKIRRANGNTTHVKWMDYFRGKGGEIEHVAFLVLWLSKFVFSTSYYCVINPHVFGIAVSLAKGVKIALAPAVLASIYRDLSLLSEKLVSFITLGRDNGLDLVLWAPFQIVQLWFWERFPTLSPNPASLSLGEPRISQWHTINKLQIRRLVEETESVGDTFLWRPYALALENWEFPEFYSDSERWLCLNSEVGDDILSFAMCLRPCQLEGMDCLEQYLPHRVGMQFGMDQGIPESLPRGNGNLNLTSLSYYLPLDGWKLYLPSRAIHGKVTVQYHNWWRKTKEFCCDLDERAPPCSSSISFFTEIQMEKSSTEGLECMGVEGDIGKGNNHTGVKEDHEETTSPDIPCIVGYAEVATLPAENNEETQKSNPQAQPQDIVIIDDDDDDDDVENDDVSRFLALVSSIEARVSNLEQNIFTVERRRG